MNMNPELQDRLKSIANWHVMHGATSGNVEEESDDETGHFRAWDVEAEKNLRLASAAPDLLAVLKLAIGDEMDITGDVGMLLGSQWKRLAVAAIRKATKDAS
jgi:hypothetical protein